MKKTLFLLIAIIGFITTSFASHVMGGDITYNCVGGNNYLVTLTLYRDCFGTTIGTFPQTVTIASSCGNVNASLDWVSTTDISQVCPSATSTCSGGTNPGVEQYIFSGIGAYDIDGDSLYYQFKTPLNGPGAPIAFSGGYSVNNPIITASGMNLNSSTGEVCFSPTVAQVCVVSILVSEYRNGVLIGTQLRDMQIIVSSTCTNSSPFAGSSPVCGNLGGATNLYTGSTVVQTDANSFSMCPLDSIYFEINISDPNANNVNVSSSISTSIPGATLTIINNGTPNPMVKFSWRPTPLDAGINNFVLNLLDDACPVSASQYYSYDITVKEQPFAGEDLTICGSEWAQLNAAGGAGYTWSVLSGEPLNPSVNITCNPCGNPQVKPSITTTYLLTSTLFSTCVNTDTITINVVSDFNTFPFGDTTLCDYITVPIGVNVLPATGIYTYSWNNTPTLNNTTIANPNATPIDTTTYVATITSPFGCVKKDSVTVNVNPPPIINLIPGDTTLCLGDSINFGIQSTCTYTLEMFDSWGDGWNGQTISVYDNGNLVGTYTIATGYSNSVTFSTTNGNSIALVYGFGSFQSESSFNLIDGQGNIQFSVAVGGMVGWVSGNTYYTGEGSCGLILSNYTYNWTPSTSLSNPNIQNPVATPLTTTAYTITFTDSSGCTIDRTQTIMVDSCTITNINQLNEKVDINIFPNPSTGKFNIFKPLSLKEKLTIRLYSLEGKLIIEKIFQQNEQSMVMDISEQSKGIYYMQLIMNDRTYTKKILKD